MGWLFWVPDLSVSFSCMRPVDRSVKMVRRRTREACSWKQTVLGLDRQAVHLGLLMEGVCALPLCESCGYSAKAALLLETGVKSRVSHWDPLANGLACFSE